MFGPPRTICTHTLQSIVLVVVVDFQLVAEWTWFQSASLKQCPVVSAYVSEKIQVDNQKNELKTECKYLGIILDCHLNFQSQSKKFYKRRL